MQKKFPNAAMSLVEACDCILHFRASFSNASTLDQSTKTLKAILFSFSPACPRRLLPFQFGVAEKEIGFIEFVLKRLFLLTLS